jgi:hypothetical protein
MKHPVEQVGWVVKSNEIGYWGLKEMQYDRLTFACKVTKWH